jgi:hypothetical protein
MVKMQNLAGRGSVWLRMIEMYEYEIPRPRVKARDFGTMPTGRWTHTNAALTIETAFARRAHASNER